MISLVLAELSRAVASSPRHILSLFNVVLDIYVMVNWQLSKKVSADQCHMADRGFRDTTH